ncbi:MAG: hypothetical protein R3F43_13130 [bacterium]
MDPTLDLLVVGEAFVDFVPLHRGPLRSATAWKCMGAAPPPTSPSGRPGWGP